MGREFIEQPLITKIGIVVVALAFQRPRVPKHQMFTCSARPATRWSASHCLTACPCCIARATRGWQRALSVVER